MQQGQQYHACCNHDEWRSEENTSDIPVIYYVNCNPNAKSNAYRFATHFRRIIALC